ncbi:hypothetical protein J4418_04125 [Candidatus Woesearchaeota archaeon]|nr:hypothetical protein [Candidatus Woesearchaeota archaeon]
MIEDIIKITEKIKKEMESNIPVLEEYINLMIKNKERSQNEIESMLDILLEYISMGMGEEQFKKLNHYYGLFNPEFSAKYNEFYHELFD